jgi:hypothetical protein
LVLHLNHLTAEVVQMEGLRWSKVLYLSKKPKSGRRGLGIFVHQASGTLRPRSQTFVLMKVDAVPDAIEGEDGIGFCFASEIKFPVSATCLSMPSPVGLQMPRLMTGAALARKLSLQGQAIEWSVHVVVQSAIGPVQSRLERLGKHHGSWNPKMKPCQEDMPELEMAVANSEGIEKPFRRMFGKQPLPREAQAMGSPHLPAKDDDTSTSDTSNVFCKPQKYADVFSYSGIELDIPHFDTGRDCGTGTDTLQTDMLEFENLFDQLRDCDDSWAAHTPNTHDDDDEQNPDPEPSKPTTPDDSEAESEDSTKKKYAPRTQATDMNLVREVLGPRPSPCCCGGRGCYCLFLWSKLWRRCLIRGFL